MYINRFKTVEHNHTHKRPPTGRLYKIKISVILAVLTISSVSSFIGPSATQAATARSNSVANSKKRILLKNFSLCMGSQFIDEDDNIKGNSLDDLYGDLFDGDANKEFSVVGFSIDSGNGMWTCKQVVMYVLRNYLMSSPSDPASEAAAKKWLIERLTGVDVVLVPGQDTDLNAKPSLDKSVELANIANDELHAIPLPSYDIMREQINPLVNLCFSATTGSGANYDESRGDFKVNGLGTFQQKDDMDWPKWLTKNDGIFSTTNVELGDRDLGFQANFVNGGIRGGDWKQNNGDDSSDFYPFRPDVSEASGYKHESSIGIVDCHFIKKNKSWIFADGGTINDVNGTITLNKESGEPVDPDAASPDPDASGNNGGDDKSDPCSIVEKGGLSGAFNKIAHPITWFTCAIANTLTGWVDDASLMVGKVLCFNPLDSSACSGSAAVQGSNATPPDDPLNDQSALSSGDDVDYSGASIEDIWGNFRNIANTLFAVALMVIIISEALGIGLLDAYTIKRMLPKLIVAIILCNLSYSICGFIIQFVNIIGVNIGHLIVSTVTGGDPNMVAAGIQNASNTATGPGGAFTSSMFQGLIVIGMGYAIFAIVASGGLGLAPILIFLLSFFIAAMIAFLMLLLRQIILIILIVISPLAFAAWVLPSGESLFKKWWKIFSELLFMFPIIMAMLAMGQVVAVVMGVGKTTGLGFNGILAMIALVAPFFAIPATFKMSVSSLNGVSNFLSSKGKGIMDKGKNWRDNSSQWGWRKGMKQMARKSARDRKGLKSLDGDSRMGRYRQRAVTGAKSKRGLNSAANKAILGNLQAQQEKTEFDESLAGLQHETQNMGRAAMLEQLRGIATGGGDSTQKRAAIHMMTQQKDVAGLQSVQEHMLGSGEHQVWNRAMAENYGDLQTAMPHLATELDDKILNAADPNAALKRARLDKLAGLSDEAIAGMHDATWKELSEPLRDGGGRPIRDAAGNPAYKLGEEGRRFAEEKYNHIVGPDPSNPANPRLAGQMAQSTKDRFINNSRPTTSTGGNRLNDLLNSPGRQADHGVNIPRNLNDSPGGNILDKIDNPPNNNIPGPF